MDIALDDDIIAIKARRGLVGADLKAFQPASAESLAALPELVADGQVFQKSGAALLRDAIRADLRMPDCDPGYEAIAPFREIDFDCEKRLLMARLAWPKGNQTFNPPWEQEVVEAAKKGKDGEPGEPTIKFKALEGVPHLRHRRRFQHMGVLDGVAQIDNPEMPVNVLDEYEGRTDDLRWVVLRVAPDADHKEFSRVGCHVDQAGMGRFRQINLAMIGSNASQSVVYTIADKGWVWFPGCARPYYAYGDRVVIPHCGQEMRAATRSGNGTPKPMGVQTVGSFQGWKEAIKLVLRNPAIATLLGFSASSALLGLIKELEAGLIHLIGGSGHGKTTALKVCASLIGSADGPRDPGSYLRSWNSTPNAVAGPLEARSDAPSFFDELYELPQNTDLLALLYRITNGRDKERMSKELDSLPTKNWRTQILSSGEGSFASRLSQEGHEYFPGGLQFRVPEIHIDTVPFWSHVAAEASEDDHGCYGDLVRASRASAPTPQARVVEAIELALKANNGHFWPRWIARLQTAEGGERAAAWFEEERSGLESSIPAGANSVYIRRSKHVAASMAGLRGILEVCEFGSEFDAEVLDAARSWAKIHLWPAGIDIMAAEGESIHDRFRNWIISRESELVRVGEPYAARNRPSIGWVDREGACVLPSSELKKIAATLKIDHGRLEKAMAEASWSKERKRHPNTGRVGSIRISVHPSAFRSASQHAKALIGRGAAVLDFAGAGAPVMKSTYFCLASAVLKFACDAPSTSTANGWLAKPESASSNLPWW